MSSAAQVSCTVCGKDLPAAQIYFGKQPPSNRFMQDSASAAQLESHVLSVCTCTNCGTVQLFDRMPMEAFRPRYDWLAYNEPEGHLDAVAKHLAKLPGIDVSSRFMGITYKDQSTLTRMLNMGFSNTICLQDSDIETTVSPFGLETVQAVLSSPVNVSRLKEQFGQADVLLLRHITEHSLSCSNLLKSLSALVAPNGYMMLELPDSQRLFNASNYPFIWEEHISYFTENSARRLAQEVNAQVAWLGRYTYPYEDSLNVVLNFSADPAGVSNDANMAAIPKQTAQFFNQFNEVRNHWHNKLQKIRAKGDKIAVFGAGHLAVKFINFFEIKDLITCVIDDHPKKVGMYMPGSGLPIVPSTQLQKLGILYCVSTLNPESEVKVRKKIAHFFDNGGTFLPAFSAV
ncbi:class I SAM-dependent methyltransferase [Amylibacter sp.]|jgi:hypothetical protein|nr:class I SAM-dependent methyltransferase [Amylibacter sp.]